jgi:hypothetical protein
MRRSLTALSLIVLLATACSSPSSGGGSGSTKFGSDVPNYGTSGTVSTNIGSDVPAWIKNNFTNIRAYMDGTTIVIETRSLPPYHTVYYGSSSAYYDASTAAVVTNPNVIAERAITLRVPETPSISSATLNSQKSSAGLGVIGVSVNGVVLFNDDANTNAGDEIVNEVPTMDTLGGHPTETGVYHYHTRPAVLSTNGGDELLGIAIDGLPIFGPKGGDGSVVFDAGGNSSAANSTNYRTQSNWIAASTQGAAAPSLYADSINGAGLPDVHYHVVSNFYLATTKDMPPQGTAVVTTGTIEPDFYMIGDYIAGTKGSESDAVSP